MGEPDRSSSPRLDAAVELFRRSGLETEASSDIRHEIWRKLVVSVSGNPLSALTRLTATEMAVDPELSRLMVNVAKEAMAVATALGWDVRSSMLQDVLLKRPLEVEALLGQIQAFARETSVAVPTIDVILPLVRGLDRALRAS